MINRLWFLLSLAFVVVGCTPAQSASQTGETQATAVPQAAPSTPALVTATVVMPTVTTTIAVSVPATATSLPQPRLQLTFVRDTRPGYEGIYAMEVGCPTEPDPCLGVPQLLFEMPKPVYDFAWSPDGSRVVFTSRGVNKKPDIFLADWNGANVVNLTSSAGSESRAVWSPDGTQIAYIYGSATEDIAIRSLNLADGSTERLLGNVFNPDAFVWLPDGSLVAYIAQISDTDGRTQITVADMEGRVLNLLPTGATDFTRILQFSSSPGGQRFAFTGSIVPRIPGPKTNNIYVTDRISGEYIALTDDLSHNLGPAWSPIGDQIAFASDRDGNYDVYLISADGSGLLKVTNSDKNESNPAWRFIPLP